MFIDKWKPLYAAEDESGVAEPEATETETEQGTEPADGPGSGRSNLRKQLESGFEAGRKAAAVAERGAKPAKGRRIAGGAEIEPAESAETTEEGTETEAQAQPETTAPEAFSKEAKASWAKVPPTVQAAILKRETDTAKGVEELKNKYKDIDTALTPHMNAIRQHGHTPGQAVNQLFSWFQALSANPDVAFPALAKSFGYDLAKFVQAQQAQPAATDPNAQQAQPAGAIPPELQKYITDLQAELNGIKQSFGKELVGLKSTFQQQNDAKTQEILSTWSKDKPHFEEVRGLMAQLIQSGAIPIKNEQVDLDGAYQMALYAHPDVRAKVLAEQQAAQQAEAKAKAAALKKQQEEQAVKARRAGSSLGGGAPGEAGAQVPGKKGKGRSVRESILAAREELSE